MPTQTTDREQKTTLSVVIAAFNAAATLGRAIESVLAQGQPGVDVIVVDDGSRDNTSQVARSYDTAVRCVRQGNAGVAAARNAGVREATGDWVAFLDADDWYLPGRIRHQRELIQRYPEIDFCIGNYFFCDPDGNPVRDAMQDTNLGRVLLSDATGQSFTVVEGDLVGRLITEYFGHTSTFSLPRETFLRLGGYPEGVRVGEDLNLLIRACAVSRRVGVVLEPLSAYVLHDTGLVRSDRVDAQRETVTALEPLLRSLPDAPAAVRHAVRARARAARLDLASALLRKGEKWQAVTALLPQLVKNPGWGSVKDLLSVVKG